MKKIQKSLVFAALALLAFSCGEPEPEVVKTPLLTIVTKTVDFTAEGGESTLSFIANMDWTLSCDNSWFRIATTSGSGSDLPQEIKVAADPNTDSAPKEATVTITVSSLKKELKITQKVRPTFKALTVAEFLDIKDNNTKFRITADVASIVNDYYGDIYLIDDTGYIYVYGIKAKEDDTEETFQTLGIKPGDRITLIGKRSLYNGSAQITGAYVESIEPAAYKGWAASSTKAGWMELPATSDRDGYYIAAHMFKSNGFSGRSFTLCWDAENQLSLWEAYPIFRGSSGSGKRTDAYAYDPLIPVDKQFAISKTSFKGLDGKTGDYVRGHQIPSMDRLNYKDNIELFFSTNIFPQHTELNDGIWGNLEDKVQSLANKCDTMYVVTGVFVGGSKEYVLDNNQKHVTVPSGCYKALLRYSKNDGYSGVAFYMENKKPASGVTVSSSAMSIDDLEKKVGVDFFVNLPAAVGDAEAADIEKADPSTLSWL